MMKKLLLSVLLSVIMQGASFAQSNDRYNSNNIDSLYQNLSEVIISAEKPIVKLENGKIIYNMPNLLEKLPADNAYDAIKQIPGVTSLNDRLTFASSNITLIINGKPSMLTQEQVVERLKNMAAVQLYKVELMLAAPAKYHVRGAAINIVTMDYAGQHHTSGQLQGTYNQSKYARGYGKGSFLHVNGNITFDLNYAYTNGKTYGEMEHDAQHPLNGQRMAYHDKTTNKSKGFSHDFRAEIDYRIAQNHTIDLAYTLKNDKSDSHNWSVGNSISDQFSMGHNYLHNFDLNYALPFGLRLSGAYTCYLSPRDQRLNGKLNDTERNLTVKGKQNIRKWMIVADQEHNLGNGWELNYGVKFQKSNNNSFQITLDANGERLPEATSSVDINERIMDGYLGFFKQIGRSISVDGSLTVENFHTPIWNDWRLYPSLNVTWMINQHHLLNLAFDSDATYPDYWSTMNQIFYSSPYSEIWGNPLLKPSRDYRTSLTWQINRKYTFVAFADISPNYFVQMPYQSSDRMAVIMKEVNFNHRNTFGVQAMAQFGIGSWFNGNAFVAGLYSNDKCDDFFDIAFDRTKFSVRMGSNATAILSKRYNLRLILNPVFQSNTIQGVYDIQSMFSVDASLRWASNNGAWNVIISGYNLTNRKYCLSSTIDNQNFNMKMRQDWTTAALSIIYKFGSYKEKQHKEIDTSRLRQ